MSIDVSIVELPARPYVGIRRRVAAAQIAATCGEVLGAVGGWLGAKGVAPDGMPIMVYHSHDADAGEFDLQPGFFVTEAVEGEGDITAGVTKAGATATAVHAGPYDTLGETWGAVWAWVADQGRTVSQPAWEIYVTDPGAVPDPADWRTEIYVPLD